MEADFLGGHFCVKEAYSQQCASTGRLLGQAWLMWQPIGRAGMVAQVRQGRENGKVGWWVGKRVEPDMVLIFW
jgi:hypothetical protein